VIEAAKSKGGAEQLDAFRLHLTNACSNLIRRAEEAAVLGDVLETQGQAGPRLPEVLQVLVHLTVPSSKGAQNSFTHYNNLEVDRLLEQARMTLDSAARKPLYQQAQKLIVDDAAICFVLTATVAALSRANVHNVPLGPMSALGASQAWKTG
jgi:ABC-type transport system substrate-binding protein